MTPNARIRTVTLGALTALSVAAPAAQAVAPAEFGAIDAAGRNQVFTTAERMVATDTDDRVDVYVRTGVPGAKVTRLVSTGPAAGNGAFDAKVGGISADGARIVFTTEERLTADDTDDDRDVYARENGVTRRMSRGGGGFTGNTGGDATLEAVLPNGAAVFETKEKLSGLDQDGVEVDVYYAGDSVASLASRPTQVNGMDADQPFGAKYVGYAGEGEVVLTVTAGQLSSEDERYGDDDIYTFSTAGDHRFVSDAAEQKAAAARFVGVGDDGNLVVWTTNEPAHADDDDTKQDVYSRTLDGGAITLESGDFDQDVKGVGVSPGNDRIFIESAEEPAPNDLNANTDVYRLEDGASTLISVSPVVANTPAEFLGTDAEGNHVAFATFQKLGGAADTDNTKDIYEREGGVTRMVSRPASGGGTIAVPTFHTYSDSGDQVLFSTAERMTANDTDNATDVFARAGESMTVKRSPGNTFAKGAYYGGSTTDAADVFFRTAESLAAQDGDAFDDVYLSGLSLGATLVSVEQVAPGTAITAGPAGPTSDATPSFAAASSEPLGKLECRVDGGAFGPCGTTGALADGAHTYEARAIDRAGNVDASPAARSFTVDTRGPAVTIGRKARRATRRGRFTVRLRCPVTETVGCVGTLVLKKGGRRFAKARFTLKAGTSQAVRVKLGRRSRRVLGKRRVVRLRAVAAARDALGNVGTSTRRFRLKAPRK